MAAELPDNTQLKRRARRRLIGAIALVLLAVILLPMIFDSEKKPLDQDISIQIPNQGEYKALPAPRSVPAQPLPDQKAAPAVPPTAPPEPPKEAPKEAPKAVEAPKADAPKAEAPKAEAPKAEAPKAEAKGEAKSAKDSKADAQKARELADAKRVEALLNGANAAPKSEKSAKADAGGFAVQVGAFSTDEKVQEARDKLTAAGLKSYVEKVPTKEGSVTRVRAGPFASREAADAAVGKISALGFGNAKVVTR